ncbi:hypothetical protein ACFYSC_17980 [Streptosporangium sp. NPDC004379]|uniref:hypothetical protein n=1 Tax=Streptosporangium sp. NPDC004379 TaxID=3366189 RepID=UPI0036B96F8C
MAERKRILLRLDPAVYEAIAKWAADDLRSVNAQLEYALRLALRGVGREVRRAGREDSGHDGRSREDERDGPDGSDEHSRSGDYG